MSRAHALTMTLVVLSLPLAAAPQRPAHAPFPPEEIRLATAARSIRPGELVVLTATTAAPIDGMQVRAFARDIPAFPVNSRTWRSLVGIDLDVRTGRHPVLIDAQSGGRWLHTATELLVRPRTFGTRDVRVDEAFVNPPSDVQRRIAQEAEDLEQLWTQSASTRLWTEAFVRPVPGRTTSRFGTRSIFNAEPRGRHSGDDFLSAAGTPVQAPNAGRVVLARDLYFAGNTIVIDHGLGVFSLLAHLSVMDVHEGDAVVAGQPVGRVGATGRVSGPHLHWAVRVSGARVDPLSVLALLGHNTVDASAR